MSAIPLHKRAVVETHKNVEIEFFGGRSGRHRAEEIVTSVWRSTDAMLADVEVENKAFLQALSSRDTGGNRGSFAGTKDFGHALKLAREGWPEGRAKSAEMADMIEAGVGERLGPRFAPFLDVCGGEPDIQAYLAGEPECMVDWRLENGRVVGRVVRVLVSIGGSCGFSAETLAAKAGAVMAMIECIQRAGDAVEMWALDAGCGVNHAFFQAWCVQRAGEPVDRDSLAFWCGHPSALRRISFGLMEQMPEEWLQRCNIYSKYGWPCPELEAAARAINAATGESAPFDIMVPDANTGASIRDGRGRVNWEKANDCERWVAEAMAKLGFEVDLEKVDLERSAK